MSLQIWLPMTKDLTQQGLSDLTVANNGVILSDSGKLGKCYYFDGNAHYLEFSKSLGDLYSGDFSYAVWLKPTDDTRSIICSEYSASGASNVAFELSAARGIRLYWNGSPDIYPTNCTLPKNEWSHVVITRSGNVAMFYINGILKYTYTGTLANKTSTAKIRLGDDYRGGTSVSYMGYMNDFRIYDHALSAKEVEVLSRGLVCHYPLNGGGRGGDNIISGTSPNEVQYTYPSSSYSDKFSKISTIVPSASQYVLSFWAKSTHAGDKVRAHWYSPNTTTKSETNQGSISTAADGQIDFTLSDKWEKYWCVWTQSSTTAVKHFIFPRMFSQASGGATGTGTVSIKCVKLEEGNIPTPWMPNSADSAYSAMGYDSTTEYDVSGYRYNGTKNGTLTYSSDTTRYSVSTKFASTTYIETPSPCSNVRSASFWIKTTKPAYAVAWADAKSKLAFGIVSAGDILVSCNGGYTKKYPNSVITANVWQHIVIVRGEDIANTDLYVNGVKQTPGTSTDFWTHTSDSLIINGRGYSTPSRMNSQMSDFRLYATALSATQVAELYNTAVSVANNGTLMGYELVEG